MPRLADAPHIAAGNPYFVDEVVRLLAAEGRLDGSEPDEVPLPASVRAVIARRLQPLASAARGVLDVAAVAGSPFGLALVAEVADSSRAAVVEALDEAHRLRLVEPVEGSGATRYRFAHALVRETLHLELPAAQRMALHTAVAETIERVHAPSLDEHLAALAFHYREAVPVTVVGKALEYARRAGVHATTQLAHEEAARHFALALEILDIASTTARERCDLLLDLGAAERRSGQVLRARERFTEAARLARGLQAPELLARAVLGFSGALGGPDLSTRTDPEVVRLLEEALEGLPGGDTALRAQLLARLALELYYTAEVARRAALSEEAVAAADRSGDARSRLIALYSRNWSVLGPDRSAEQRRAADELLALARTSDDSEMRFSGHHFRMAEALERGDLLRVDAEIAECVRLAGALHQPLYVWQAGLMQAMRELLRGRTEEGERLALTAYESGRSVGEETAANLLAAQRYLHRWISGRMGELAGGIDAFAAQWPWIPAWRCAVALLRAELGEDEAALVELDALGARGFTDMPRDGNWGLGIAMVSYAAASIGSRRHAAALLPLLEPVADRVTVLAGGFVSVGPLALAAASVSATLERWEEADAHFARAREICTRLEARPILAFANRERARMLLARGAPGDAAAAAQELRTGRREAGVLGMARLVEQLDDLAGRAPAAAPVASSAAGRRAVLQRRGEAWAVGFEPEIVHLRDSKGLNHLARLLAHPGVEFHAIDLASGGWAAGAAVVDPALPVSPGLGDAGPRLDPEAKAAYRARISDLRDEVVTATRRRDTARASALQAELDAVSAELGAAVGLGGRDRHDASAAERARVNVTRAVRQAIARIAEHDERLGHDLSATVRTGTFVSYEPPPAPAVTWDVRG